MLLRMMTQGNGELSDLAGIYMLGVSPGSVVRGNHVTDAYPYFEFGHGIYLDQAASEILVIGNLAYHTEGATLYEHYGHLNNVTNNVIALATVRRSKSHVCGHVHLPVG